MNFDQRIASCCSRWMARMDIETHYNNKIQYQYIYYNVTKINSVPGFSDGTTVVGI